MSSPAGLHGVLFEGDGPLTLKRVSGRESAAAQAAETRVIPLRGRPSARVSEEPPPKRRCRAEAGRDPPGRSAAGPPRGPARARPPPAGSHTQPAIGGAEVALDRALGEVEPSADLRVGVSGDRQGQHLLLAVGEAAAAGATDTPIRAPRAGRWRGRGSPPPASGRDPAPGRPVGADAQRPAYHRGGIGDGGYDQQEGNSGKRLAQAANGRRIGLSRVADVGDHVRRDGARVEMPPSTAGSSVTSISLDSSASRSRCRSGRRAAASATTARLALRARAGFVRARRGMPKLGAPCPLAGAVMAWSTGPAAGRGCRSSGSSKSPCQFNGARNRRLPRGAGPPGLRGRKTGRNAR